MSRGNQKSHLWKTLAGAAAGRPTDLSGLAHPEWLDAAEEHGVTPLISHQRQAGRVTGVREAPAERLRDAAYHYAAHDLLMIKAAREALELFAAEGIDVLLLKGLPVALLHYPQTWLRPRSDIDLYIHPSDRERVARLLAGHGYALVGAEGREATSRQFMALTREMHDQTVSFDVHFRLSNRPLFHDTLTFEECRATRQAVPALGRAAYAPSDVHLLIHACVHRIGHGRNTGRNRLIWLYDIHRLFEALDGGGREGFAEEALAKRIGALCHDALAVTADLFGTELPEGLAGRLTANRADEPSAPLIHASKLRWAWADLQAVEGFVPRMQYARELLMNRFER